VIQAGRCLAVGRRGWRLVRPQTRGGSLARAHRLGGGMRPCVSESGKKGVHVDEGQFACLTNESVTGTNARQPPSSIEKKT
jgi:hypothetical protein